MMVEKKFIIRLNNTLCGYIPLSLSLRFEKGFWEFPLYIAAILVYVQFCHIKMYSVYKLILSGNYQIHWPIFHRCFGGYFVPGPGVLESMGWVSWGNCFQGWNWAAPSQWDTSLQGNDITYWLGASLESALCFHHTHREDREISRLHFFRNDILGIKQMKAIRTPSLCMIIGNYI